MKKQFPINKSKQTITWMKNSKTIFPTHDFYNLVAINVKIDWSFLVGLVLDEDEEYYLNTLKISDFKRTQIPFSPPQKWSVLGGG